MINEYIEWSEYNVDDFFGINRGLKIKIHFDTLRQKDENKKENKGILNNHNSPAIIHSLLHL